MLQFPKEINFVAYYIDLIWSFDVQHQSAMLFNAGRRTFVILFNHNDLIVTISRMTKLTRPSPYLPLSQDHPSSLKKSVIFGSKTDTDHWLRVVIKAPDRSLHQDRIEGQVLSLCNANCSLYPCKNVYIADSVTRESKEWSNVGQICYFKMVMVSISFFRIALSIQLSMFE